MKYLMMQNMPGKTPVSLFVKERQDCFCRIAFG